MVKGADDQNSTAEFFSALLLDEQNGLSPTKQQQAARFALDSTCNIINYSITENLRQLTAPQFAQWIAQPLEQQLQTAQPSALDHDFFLAGDKLLEEWPQLVRQAIKERGHLDWSIEQVEDMALIGSGATEVVAWAGNRLPLPYWLTPISSLRFSQQISLAELNSMLMLNAPALSARHLLLAQGGLTLIAGNSQIVKIGFLTRTLGQDMYWVQALERARVQGQGGKRYLDMAQLLDLLQALDRALTRVLNGALDRDRIVTRALGRAFIVSRDPALTRDLAMALSTAITSPRLEQTEEYSDALVIIGADTEWLAFQPDREEERSATIAGLREFLSADDDWTRLQAINYLITLSAGTPELCAERNRLLDLALQETDKFTFPDALREVTQSQDFITKEFPEAIRIIFLHEPGDPLLKPEWFDPSREESRLFLSSPREFFAIAAEVLDPEGETELAKWRKQ